MGPFEQAQQPHSKHHSHEQHSSKQMKKENKDKSIFDLSSSEESHNRKKEEESKWSHGTQNRMSAERMREKEEKMREKKEKAREKKFESILWRDQHHHKMWQLMKSHKPIYGKTASGRHMIVAQHINPHGQPMMVSMHNHMPNDRQQWMPQGLYTNVKKHRGSYMVHDHDDGDHNTIVNDENRYAHGADLTQSVAAAANIQQYDVYDDELFDFDAIYERYNNEKYEEDLSDEYNLDEFIDDDGDEWIISDIVNSLESAFYNLFGGKNAE